MRIRGAFFADHVDQLPDGGMDVHNGGWSSVELPVDECWVVLLCDIGGDDAGQTFTLFIDVLAPNGVEAKPALKLEYQVPVGSMFVSMRIDPMAQQDVEGRYVYTFRLDDDTEQQYVVVPLEVRFRDGSDVMLDRPGTDMMPA